MADFSNIDLKNAFLEKEWVITIQTPVQGQDQLLAAMRKGIDLKQGHYDCCLHLSATGEQQFRALEGSHAGDEKTVQSVPTVDITISIAAEEQVLRDTLAIILQYHVHEEPTIRISECWGMRSKYTGDRDNPNKYWNRADAHDIHGTVVSD